MKKRHICLSVLFFSYISHAQIHQLPTEKIESTAITSFSENTSAWPSQSFDSELLQSSNISLYETLNKIPGIETRGSLSKGSPAVTLRGSTKASRTLLLYDGIPLNLTDGIGAQEFLIPRETLATTHIIKGPASVYYGANAMSGAINFTPEFYSRSRVRVTSGSFGQKGIFGALSVLNDERNQLQVTGFNESIDGDYPYYSTTSGKSGQRTRTDTHTQRATISGNHNLSGYKVGYRFLQAQEFGSSPGSIHALNATKAQKNGTLAAVKASKTFGPRYDAKIYATNIQTQSEFLDEASTSLTNSYANQASTGFMISYNEDTALQLMFLGDYKESLLKTSSTGGQTKQTQEFEPGLLIAFPFSEDIILQSGIRYLPSYGATTKALGLLRTQENRRFWVTYSEGYRTPSLSDKHDQYGTFHGNPNLKPEESNQIEIGFGQQSQKSASNFMSRFNYEAAVFSTNYENLIVSTPDLTTVQNLDFVKAYGAELSVDYPFALWSVGLGYSYLDVSSNGRPLAYSVEQKIQSSIAHYFGPLVLELQSNSWVNYHRTSSNPDKDSWNTFDFKVRTIGISDWVFSGGVYNMFDEPIEYMAGYPEPRKRLFASVERLF